MYASLEKASALGSDNPSLPLLSQNARIRCLAITVLEEIHYILCLPLHDKMEKMLHNIRSQLTDMAILTNYYYVQTTYLSLEWQISIQNKPRIKPCVIHDSAQVSQIFIQSVQYIKAVC